MLNNVLLRLSVNLMVYSGITVMTFAFCCSLIGIRKRTLDFKFLCFFLGCTLFTELLAAYFNLKYKNNLAVYQLMGPVVMIGSSLYFNYSIAFLKKYRIGYLTAGTGIIFTVVNILYFQGLHKLNTNFAQLECLFNVCYSLFFFYKFADSGNVITFRTNPYFWNALLFLIFYLGSFLSWGLINMLLRKNREAARTVYLIVYLLNMVFYTGLGMVFLFLHPRKQTASVAKIADGELNAAQVY